MTERKAQRHPSNIRIFFSSEDLEGESTASNLSKHGCRVESDTVLAAGTEVELWLFSSDFEWPLKVEKAVVRWSAPEAFGTEFLVVGTAQRERLRQLIAGRKLGAAG